MTKKIVLILFATSLLSACSSVSGWLSSDSGDKKLTGERISVLELQEKIEPADASLQVDGLVMPAAWQNEFWPQAGGYPNHAMQNLKLNTEALKPVWSTKIGKGARKDLPLTATPIVVDGKIYTMDAQSVVSAFNTSNGQQLWRVDTKKKDEDDPVISGGLAYSTGAIFVTNGYNELLSLDPATGDIKWRKSLPATVRAAPTVLEGRVFVQTLDNRLLVLNALDGSSIWDYQGTNESAGLVGAASTAVNQDIAVAAFSSGDVMALRVANGAYAWSDNLSSLKRFGGLSGISDIKALPVLDRDMAIAVSFGGRIIALDTRTGARIWSREIGSANTPWVAGNHIFVLSSDNQLVALGRDRGVIRWVTNVQPENMKDMAIFSGPVLAGGRLFLAGTGGIVIEVNPENGQIINTWDAGATVSLPPIVAGGTLYLLNDDGVLTAYK